MAKVRIIRDNAILSIEEEDLGQYEARGYKKMEGLKKESPSKDTNKK